jgi:hypothetical protein
VERVNTPCRRCCLRCRYLLPLAAGVTSWSPEQHAAFPSDVRRAARALLLAKECRGPGAVCAEGAAHVVNAVRAQGAEQPRGVQLPRDLLLRVLGLAAMPMVSWVPQLRPFLAADNLD